MYKVAHCPDSFAYLKMLPSDCVDVTITDPPYTEHVQANLCSGSLVGKNSVPKYELDFDPLTDYAFVGDLLRCTKRWVVMFCALESFGLIKAAYPQEYVRGCVWLKTNAMGQLTGDRPATAFEGICLLHKMKEQGGVKKRWNGRGSYGAWVCPGTRGEKGPDGGDRHPNLKPLKLCLKLISLLSDRGETVFDPFCGSGRIGEAAVALDRNYAGLDNSEEWVKQANADFKVQAVSDEDALKLCAIREAWTDASQ